MMKTAISNILALTLAVLLPLQAMADDEVVLRVGQKKGLTKAMLEATGQLQDLPYRVQWFEFPAAAFVFEAMGADQIDVAVAGDGPLIFAVGAGAKIRPVASMRAIDRGEANVILVKNNSTINGIADLKGKRIAVTRGSAGHNLLLAALRSVGLTSQDVTLALLAPADGKAAFDSGAVDAWGIWQPYVAIALARGDSRVVTNSAGLTSGYAFVVASDNAIAHKKAALDDFVQRLAKATKWSEENTEEYLTIESRLLGLDKEILRNVHNSTRTDLLPLDSAAVAGLKSTIDLYTWAGILRRPLSLDDFFSKPLLDQYRQETTGTVQTQ